MLIACQMTNCVVVSFFPKNEQQSGNNFEIILILKQNNLRKKSVAHIKLTFSSAWHGGKYFACNKIINVIYVHVYCNYLKNTESYPLSQSKGTT